MPLKDGSQTGPFRGNTPSNSFKIFLIPGSKTLGSESVTVHVSAHLQRRRLGGYSDRFFILVNLSLSKWPHGKELSSPTP